MSRKVIYSKLLFCCMCRIFDPYIPLDSNLQYPIGYDIQSDIFQCIEAQPFRKFKIKFREFLSYFNQWDDQSQFYIFWLFLSGTPPFTTAFCVFIEALSCSKRSTHISPCIYIISRSVLFLERLPIFFHQTDNITLRVVVTYSVWASLK